MKSPVEAPARTAPPAERGAAVSERQILEREIAERGDDPVRVVAVDRDTRWIPRYGSDDPEKRAEPELTVI